MTYSDLDYDLKAWCHDHGLTLCLEYSGEERRFCYVSGGPGECFLISVAPPAEAGVAVDAWSVETDDDAELHESWTHGVEQIRIGLDAALAQIEAWKTRARDAGDKRPPAAAKAARVRAAKA